MSSECLASPEFLRSFSIGAREKRPKSASSSSSDVSRHDRPGRGEGQDTTLRDYNGNDNSGSSTPRSRDAGDPAFDVITQQTANHQNDTRDDVDSSFVRNRRFCPIPFFLRQRIEPLTNCKPQSLYIQGGPPPTKNNSIINFFAYLESLLPQRKLNRSM